MGPSADNSQVVRYDVDLETGRVWWSDELYALFGYERSEPAQNIEWWAAHIHADDAMVVNEAIGGLVHPWTKEWTIEYRFKRADNSYVLVRDHATVGRGPAGNPIHLTGIIWPEPAVKQ